ncbi:uncharacterized protein LOC132562595 [Ylistrum balloti]|uniref:uncharacterized protein LOC132562595 n=1 Tax=Ylistrum balloti TaxID=509963 RepID=UPI0029058A66|nr:uncharacterized protein LOC132562595 [Ylistrum balloti]
MRLGITVLLLVLPLLVHSRFSDFDAVPAPQHEPVRLMDAISEDGNVVYSDEVSRLTSVKDNNFKACFITDFDPEWNLDIREKQALVNTHEPEIVRSPLQFENLKIRTGDMIAGMCKKSKIYWLTETHSQPLPSVRAAVSGDSGLPPPVFHPVVPANEESRVQPQAPLHIPAAPPKIPGRIHEPVHVPHRQVGVPQMVPAHMGIPHKVTVHMGIPQHTQMHPMRPQQFPQAQPAPAHVPAFQAPQHVPVQAPHHTSEHIPELAAFHAPAHVAVPAHKEPAMLVPRHLPFIRPHLPAPAEVPGKRHISQQGQGRPIVVPQRLSMDRPQLVHHHE